MGNSRFEDDQPLHRVTLSSFFISETEVTNAQFKSFSKSKLPENSFGDRYPVGGVTRAQALAFIRWLDKIDSNSYDLPTEAQWEYAARGGIENADYPWGNGIDATKTVIDADKVKPVGSFPPNGYGLYDMCGNLAEMVHESPYDYDERPAVDPVGSDKGTLHLVRGLGVGASMPWVWFRAINSDRVADPDTGFRLVMKIPRSLTR